jgi:hypothetical protein
MVNNPLRIERNICVTQGQTATPIARHDPSTPFRRPRASVFLKPLHGPLARPTAVAAAPCFEDTYKMTTAKGAPGLEVYAGERSDLPLLS